MEKDHKKESTTPRCPEGCSPQREFILAGRRGSISIAGGKTDAGGEDSFAGFGATGGQKFYLRVSKLREVGKMVCCTVRDTWPALQVDGSGDIFAWSQGSTRVRVRHGSREEGRPLEAQWEAIFLSLQWR